MGESVGVSVSFGKYENDDAAALCWEKWSTFSPNKYLEEVGKCSTPGSVAQKKAFFEAHYKKIAAIKAEAELLDHSRSDQPPVDTFQQDDEPITNENAQHHMSPPSNSMLEEAVLVNVESMKLVKQHFQVDLDPEPQNVAPKITPNKVEKSPIGMKKKPASRVPISPETPATTLSKSKPKPKPSSASPLKKGSAPPSSSVSSSKNKIHSLSESRHVSLHLSMSMSSVNSDAASSVTSSRRRSLFIEQMGDKDIVKRAFKTFQNRVNQLPSSDNGPKHLPTKRPEQKTWTSTSYQKENERSRKAAAAEKINPARGQSGPTWKSVSSGSLKGAGVDERRLKVGPTSAALKSNERAERRKEFLKKLEERSNAREAERSQLSLKAKDVKESEMKKARPKAKPMPKAPGMLKST